MTHLVIMTLATLGSWDILRRLLPTGVPVVAGKIACVVIAWLLITRTEPSIVLSLAVPGSLMLLTSIIRVEPFVPWGPTIAAFTQDIMRSRPRRSSATNQAREPSRQAEPPPKIGHRIPRL